MARARAVEDEIRFTKYRLDVSPDNWSAAARLRLLNDVLDGTTKSTTQAPAPQPKPRNWAGVSMKITTKLFITLAIAASILSGTLIVDSYRHGEKSVPTPTPADAIAVLKPAATPRSQ
jgi:hypothetical protein